MEKTTAYHPESDRLAYRSSVQKSTKCIPYRLMFGRKVRLPVVVIFGGGMDCCLGRTIWTYVSHLQAGLEDAYHTVREHT